MANCPNINLDSWKNLVAARGEDIAYYLWDKFNGVVPEAELTAGIETLKRIENEMGEKYWKSLYIDKRLSNKEDFQSVGIPGVANKFAPDFYNVYHGTNIYQLDDEGNLILTPSKNFEDKTTSISFTQIPVVAQDYMLRKDGNIIIKIKNQALGDNYDVESAEEIAVNGNKPFVVPKGQYEIINVPTLAEKMREKYAKEVDERAQTLRESASSDIDLLDSIYSERIAADNYAEIEEYERGTEGGDVVPDWYVPDEYLSSRAARKAYNTIKDKINKTFIVNGLAEKILDIIRKGGNRIDVNDQYLDNLSTYGTRYSPHGGSLFDFLLNEINADKTTRQAIVNDIKKIVDNNQQSAIDFYNSEEQVAKREEQKRIDEENFKKFRQVVDEEIDFLPFQLVGTETSKASPETIAKIKNFLGRIGVDVKEYNSIVVNGVKQNANAAALVTQKLIQIVNGKEGVALTEEAMHFALEIIKQTNPALYNKLLREINSYQLYKQVLADYGTDPLYQTPEGKPDIRKLKDEAIAKVLSETIVNQNEGSLEKPENLARVESWWTNIVDWLKNLFNIKSGFDEAALKVLSGEEIGTADDIRAEEGSAFLQKSKQDDSVDRLKSMDSRLSIKDTTVNDKTEPRYFLDDTTQISGRVSDEIKNWYSKRFNNNEITKDDRDKAIDEMKKDKGTKGHADQDYLIRGLADGRGGVLVDENGYLRAEPLDDSGYVSQIDPNDPDRVIYNTLKENLYERLQSFGEGTRFLSEVKIYDPKFNKAGTIDLIAITKDGKIHLLDWKFMDLNVDVYTDVPWYKVAAWKNQMDQYKTMLINAYGFKSQDFGQTRMIPIRTVYSGSTLLGIEIGAVDPKEITDDYLIPVGLEEEATGNEQVDSLLKELNADYKLLSEKSVLPSEKKEKAVQLNALFSAIRQLQMRQNIAPLLEEAKLLNNYVQKVINRFETEWKGNDPLGYTEEDRNAFLKEIRDAEKMLGTYTTLDINLSDMFLSGGEENEKLENEVAKTVRFARNLEDKLDRTKTAFVRDFVGKSEKVKDVTKEEKEIGIVAKWFSDTATLQLNSAKILFRKANRALTKAAMDSVDLARELQEIEGRYKKWAASKGLSKKDYFNYIKKKGKNELIDEYNPEFYKELKSRIDRRDPDLFAWIKDNVDIKAYNEFLQEQIKKETESINQRYKDRMEFNQATGEFYLSEEQERKKEFELNKMKKAYNTSTTTGAGWLQYDFIKKFPKTEKWESEQWKELFKKDSSGNYVNKPAVDLYNYIRKINDDYRQIGYLGRGEERVFLPWVRKSLVESLLSGGRVNLIEQFLRSITVDPNADTGLGKVDKSGKPIDEIPKYFTSEIEGDVSEDLFRNLALYNNMALKYKYLSQIEQQALALVEVEQNKGAIATSWFSKTQYDKKTGKVVVVANNSKNAELIDNMVKGIIYGQRYLKSDTFDQALGRLGKVGERINKVLGVKIFPDVEGRVISLNKSLSTLNRTFSLQTMGLNPLSATSNLFGGTSQSLINSGKYFTKADYLASESKVNAKWLNFISEEEKKKYIGALDYFLPLTENYTNEIAKELSLNALTADGIQNFLMSLMRNSDKHVQTVNFFAYLNNSVVIDGNVVNAREYLRTTPEYSNMYEGTADQRKQREKKFEDDVKKLVDEKGVLKVAQVVDNKFVIPGVDRKSESVIDLRRKVQQVSKDALGNLTEDSRRLIDMNIYGNSFMLFKNWIPRLVDVRIGDLKYNSASDAYEWGRMRVTYSMLSFNVLQSISRLRNAIAGNDEGVAYMREMYEKKKEEYETETGKTLELTESEFIDLVRRNLQSQMIDLMFYLTLIGLFWALKANAPDDDEDPLVKNRYRVIMRATDKLKDEIAYFYNPANLLAIVSGGVFPAIGQLNNYEKLLKNFMQEMFGVIINDKEMTDDAHVIKYVMKSFPIANQLSQYLPVFAPDVAKDLGIKMQSQSGIR